MEQETSKYSEIASRIYREFTDVADYIWKAPRLLEHERDLETQKLKNYFPNDEEHAKLRWHFEGKKLDSVFPYLIAAGNTFSVMSLFESYLLLIAGELEIDTKEQIKSVCGTGINRFLKYFRKIGINVENIQPYHQISAAIKIRNCLSHSSGMLVWSKDAEELKNIQKSGLYLSKEHRLLRNRNGREYDEVRTISSGLGDRIQVNNMYPFVLSSYLRDFLDGLCQEAEAIDRNEVRT